MLRVHLADLNLQLLQLGREVARPPDVVGALPRRVVVADVAPPDLQVQHCPQGVVGADEDDQGLNPAVSAVCLRGLHRRERLVGRGITSRLEHIQRHQRPRVVD